MGSLTNANMAIRRALEARGTPQTGNTTEAEARSVLDRLAAATQNGGQGILTGARGRPTLLDQLTACAGKVAEYAASIGLGLAEATGLVWVDSIQCTPTTSASDLDRSVDTDSANNSQGASDALSAVSNLLSGVASFWEFEGDSDGLACFSEPELVWDVTGDIVETASADLDAYDGGSSAEAPAGSADEHEHGHGAQRTATGPLAGMQRVCEPMDVSHIWDRYGCNNNVSHGPGMFLRALQANDTKPFVWHSQPWLAKEHLAIEEDGACLPRLPGVTTLQLGVDIHLDHKPLAAGTYGAIYQAFWPDAEIALAGTGCTDVLVKVSKEDGLRNLMNERDNLVSVGPHPNIIQLLAQVNMGKGQLGLVVPQAPAGSLLDALDDKMHITGRPFSSYEAVWRTADIVRGLLHLHSRGRMHSDVKPGNTVVFDDGTCKLIDFGSCVLTIDGVVCGAVPYGTPAYASYEHCVAMGCLSSADDGQPADIDSTTVAKVGQPADIFSVGVILLHLVTGDIPDIIYIPSERQTAYKVPMTCSKALADIIDICLRHDPQERPTAAQLLQLLDQLEADMLQQTQRVWGAISQECCMDEAAQASEQARKAAQKDAIARIIAKGQCSNVSTAPSAAPVNEQTAQHMVAQHPVIELAGRVSWQSGVPAAAESATSPAHVQGTSKQVDQQAGYDQLQAHIIATTYDLHGMPASHGFDQAAPLPSHHIQATYAPSTAASCFHGDLFQVTALLVQDGLAMAAAADANAVNQPASAKRWADMAAELRHDAHLMWAGLAAMLDSSDTWAVTDVMQQAHMTGSYQQAPPAPFPFPQSSHLPPQELAAVRQAEMQAQQAAELKALHELYQQQAQCQWLLAA